MKKPWLEELRKLVRKLRKESEEIIKDTPFGYLIAAFIMQVGIDDTLPALDPEPETLKRFIELALQDDVQSAYVCSESEEALMKVIRALKNIVKHLEEYPKDVITV